MQRMIVLLMALALPGAIGAATLTIESDKLTYAVGETITLTVSGDDEGGLAYTIYGRLLYDASRTSFDGTTQSPVGEGWIPGPLSSGDGFADAFFQKDQLFGGGASDLPGVVSVVTVIADAVGIVPVSWAPDLFFFGLTSAPGTSITIVPEPGTAALLGLGLLTLAGRRRTRRGSLQASGAPKTPRIERRR